MTNDAVEYGYRPDTRQSWTLGLLMVILGPILIATSFQMGPDEVVDLRGVGRFSGVAAPWALRIVALLIMLFGYLMAKCASVDAKENPRLVLKENGIVLAGSSSETIEYAKISDVATTPGKRDSILTLTHTGGVITLSARRMKSLIEFNDMCAQLVDRVGKAESRPIASSST